MNQYEKYIIRCIELAGQGEGKVSPNPLVGAIVLDENNKIIGEGYHQKYGEAHAEVNALLQAGDKTKNSTLVVSLEPCSHYGKTPPCADLIIEKGVKKLIVGMKDPNPRVNGEGIKKCIDAGIEVVSGVLEDECRKLNEIFIKNVSCNKPFIAVKTACTMDGKIATKTGSSKWITSEKARDEVQRLRNKYDAILTSSNTVIADNPSMNCRIKNGVHPIRVVIDSKLRTSPDSKIYNDDGTKVYIVVREDIEDKKTEKFTQNIEFIKTPSRGNYIDLEYLINELYKKGVRSIIVEAGAELNGTIIKQNLTDKVYMFMAPKILGDKESLGWVEGFDISDINNSMQIKFDKIKHFEPDILVEGYF